MKRFKIIFLYNFYFRPQSSSGFNQNRNHQTFEVPPGGYSQGYNQNNQGYKQNNQNNYNQGYDSMGSYSQSQGYNSQGIFLFYFFLSIIV